MTTRGLRWAAVLQAIKAGSRGPQHLTGRSATWIFLAECMRRNAQHEPPCVSLQVGSSWPLRTEGKPLVVRHLFREHKDWHVRGRRPDEGGCNGILVQLVPLGIDDDGGGGLQGFSPRASSSASQAAGSLADLASSLASQSSNSAASITLTCASRSLPRSAASLGVSSPAETAATMAVEAPTVSAGVPIVGKSNGT
jgi:hypothetical protein